MEQLYNKQNPNTQQDVFIQFDVLKNKTREPEQQQREQTQEQTREPAVKIMDYSKRGLVNRQDVLNRLNKSNRNPFLVKPKEQGVQNAPAPVPVPVPLPVPVPVPVPAPVPAPVQVPSPILEKEPIEQGEPIDPMEPGEPIDPMEPGEPMEPMDQGEPLIPEVTKPMDQGEPILVPKKTKLKLKIRNPDQTGEKQKPAKPEKKLDIVAAALSLQNVLSNLPKKRPSVQIRASSYYLNNRKLFIQKIADLYKDYRNEMVSQKDAVSCETMGAAGADFDLLTHQKIVRDYLSLYTPYRGLLLYHGLGGGKSCTSIAVAEGLKSDKKVFLMTPASLKSNYFNEIKKCGDELYKKNQNWQFISVEGQPAYPAVLAKALSIQETSIKKAGGAWVVDVSKPPNFGTLTPKQQNEIDTQLNEMIRSKYTDINYNGLNMNIINRLTTNKTINPFDNAVVVIDEAHNFVSRIVNKLKDPKSISFLLYDLLMRANNARIVLLTGTPIINYPKEIAILFNILRGYIKTWSMQVTVGSQGGEINKERILELFHENKLATYDYVDYTGNVLTITRNPFGFVNTEKRGVAQGTKRVPNPEAMKPNPGMQGAASSRLGMQGGLSKKKVLNKNTNKSKNKTKKSQKEDKKEVLTNNTKSKPIANLIAPKLSTDEPIEPSTQEELQQIENQYGEQNNELYRGGEGEEGGVINPYTIGGTGEFNKYNGVRLDEMGNYSDEDFIQRVVAILSKTYNVAERSIQVRLNKALPDGSVKAEENKFMEMFIDVQSGDLKNVDLFQRRILGLTSYFRSAQEGLLPNFVLTPDKQVYHIEKSEMSEHQFGIYAKIRAEEADQEKRNTRKRAMVGTGDELFKIASTYRIFSRAACNFVFPDGIDRPLPSHGEDKEVDEMDVDVVPKEARQLENSYLGFGEEKEDHEEEPKKAEGSDEMAKMEDEATETANDNDYMRRIEQALAAVDAKDPVSQESVYLNEGALLELSPKFLKVLKNLKDGNNNGLHLLYSHFRTIEGIGILRLILLANGFAEFKLRKTLTNIPLPIGEAEQAQAVAAQVVAAQAVAQAVVAQAVAEAAQAEEKDRYQWNIVDDDDPSNRDKPKFVLYTGTESFEEREIILNIYNGKWEYVPKNIRAQLEAEQADKKNTNKNMYGDVIKAIMITSSGAEGINLTNTRFVHIVEPYWHMVRVDQVIGRARRICSHKDLPQELQTVKVFLYVTTLSEKQQTDEGNIELRNRDVSRIDRQTPVTTDESLYETATLKNRINNQILYAVKQTAMDCKLYSGLSKTDEEPIVCYNFGEITSNNFGSIPAFDQDAELKEDLNVAKTKAAIKKVKIGDTQYAYNTATNEVYELESFERAQKTGTEPIVVGKLVKQAGKYVLERN